MKTNRAFQHLHQADLRLLLWCWQSAKPAGLIRTAKFVSRTGDGYFQILVPLLAWLYSQPADTAFLKKVAIALVVERCLYWLLKNALRRPRPPAVIPNFQSAVTASDQFSFPSGHTMAAFMLAGLMYLEVGTVALLLYPWACAVGISRVILGVHFPTDILAGAAIGSAVAVYIVSMV